MIEGSGPGRGVPLWRWRRVLTIRKVTGQRRHEPVSRSHPREGRLIKRIKPW